MSSKRNFRIFSWNVNGLRAIQKKGFLDWVKKESPDILCLQETKASLDQLDETLTKVNNYCFHYFPAERKGYSGVATYTKIKPLSVKLGFNNLTFDVEGRVIETYFEKFVVYNVYFPNSGMGPERLRYKLDFYDAFFFYLEKVRKRQKHIIVCGDYNTAHKEIDLARPKENENSAGFMPVEREWLDKIINLGYIDIFREYNKEPGQYTYWDFFTRARERNAGWRIDYFFVTKEARKLVSDMKIHMSVMGSDHCPIELDLDV
ncbi:MAG: exodeoxyribonuclease III [Ignavibacteria bacterium]